MFLGVRCGWRMRASQGFQETDEILTLLIGQPDAESGVIKIHHIRADCAKNPPQLHQSQRVHEMEQVLLLVGG
jgi:hypothetical protein